ncbi:MAG TPA: glutamine--tRNA ligase/YqeY domain fusion protein [Candidatus Krumholzibacteria bacterium]|nr:glutamine--tRNA ligase/YqeY domain fusion protein [Candidatus Krumholzibacteria bacterium]HPD70629.1 glutamine--tRNA ligase/YqeY domain fusion protein [Candidatus Krumholzibacteria bacterium]HRY39671.1 glutamine--tRNA ligase/YqeY domain fusion protein [Candidatus Krumholzibacteria bacterium]
MNRPDDPPLGTSGDAAEPLKERDFIRQIVADDVRAGRNGGRVHTRFPPEPNGYLHIGHAKSIHLNYGIAQEFGGKFNLRFDDTNPETEETEYVEAIKADVRWLGADWEDRLFYASDYFDTLYAWAVHLIENGKAYVCSLSEDEVRAYRGTVTEPGRPSPNRDRPIAESLDLFARMKAGEFPDGTYTLRARIDMAHPNMKMRDPLLYRIKHAHHHRTGDAWCIYPFYDFTHGQSDAIEGITHSICTLEFEVNRPLYDWFIENLPVPHEPHQYEFARLNLTYTIMSKRKLLRLVREGHVTGWDDPRMPTICGLRRRGYTPEAIREFNNRIGVAKADSTVDYSLLEWSIREHLNRVAPRVMAVLRPLRVVITNYPEGQVESIECLDNPEDPASGTRQVPFSREIYIERDDFREDAPAKFFRLTPGREVRLKHAYYINCDQVIKNDRGEVVELRCTYDPATRGGDSPDHRKIKGTLHWVSCAHAIDAEVRLYDHLFNRPLPEEGDGFLANLNPGSLEVLTGCKLEPSLAGAQPGDRFQFLRNAYFCVDTRDSRPGALVFNRTVTLKDTWAKIESKG